MDPISAFIFQMNIPLFTDFSKFIDVYVYHLFFVIWVLSLIFYRNRPEMKTKTIAILISLLLLYFAIQFIKIDYNNPRPCVAMLGKIACPACPPDCSFPSGHAALAFLFATAFLGTALFIPSLLLAILISLTRVYLGLHTMSDVIGGMLLGIIIYWVVDNLILFLNKRNAKKKVAKLELEKENKRKLFHMLLGLAVILVFSFFNSADGRAIFAFLLAIVFILGFIAFDSKLKKKKLPIIDFFLDRYERRDATPGHGSFWYIAGMLLLITFLSDPNRVVSSLLVLAVSDSVSTIIGRKSKRKLAYNKQKTVEGSIAFFLCSLLTFPLLGPVAFIFALFTTIIESLPIPIDDNLSVPVSSIIFFRILG